MQNSVPRFHQRFGCTRGLHCPERLAASEHKDWPGDRGISWRASPLSFRPWAWTPRLETMRMFSSYQAVMQWLSNGLLVSILFLFSTLHTAIRKYDCLLALFKILPRLPHCGLQGPVHPCQPLQSYLMTPSSCAGLYFSFRSSNAMFPLALRSFHVLFSLTL